MGSVFREWQACWLLTRRGGQFLTCCVEVRLDWWGRKITAKPKQITWKLPERRISLMVVASDRITAPALRPGSGFFVCFFHTLQVHSCLSGVHLGKPQVTPSRRSCTEPNPAQGGGQEVSLNGQVATWRHQKEEEEEPKEAQRREPSVSPVQLNSYNKHIHFHLLMFK